MPTTPQGREFYNDTIYNDDDVGQLFDFLAEGRRAFDRPAIFRDTSECCWFNAGRRNINGRQYICLFLPHPKRLSLEQQMVGLTIELESTNIWASSVLKIRLLPDPRFSSSDTGERSYRTYNKVSGSPPSALRLKPTRQRQSPRKDADVEKRMRGKERQDSAERRMRRKVRHILQVLGEAKAEGCEFSTCPDTGEVTVTYPNVPDAAEPPTSETFYTFAPETEDE